MNQNNLNSPILSIKMSSNTYLQTILNAFVTLDIVALTANLKERSYQDATKEIFLREVESIFEAHHRSKDTELMFYKGLCGSNTCDNCGKNGYRFVGNHSNNYFSLIFELDGDDILDIYSCTEFNTFETLEGLNESAYIFINEDEQINLYNNMFEEDYYLKALAEISHDNFKNNDWVTKHFDLYKQTLIWPKNLPPIGRSNLLKGTLREKFHSTYYEILNELEFGYELDNQYQTLKIHSNE